MSGQSNASPRDPGIMLETVGHGDVAAVCRVIVHGGLRMESLGDTSAIVQTESASVVRIAIYSSSALANGWEPFNQPIPAAYMPLAFDAFERIPFGETGGALLVQSQPLHEQLRTVVVSDTRRRACQFLPLLAADDLAGYLMTKLKAYGLPASAESACAEQLRATCTGLLAALSS